MLLTEPMSGDNLPAVFQKDKQIPLCHRVNRLLNLYSGNSGQISILREEGGK